MTERERSEEDRTDVKPTPATRGPADSGDAVSGEPAGEDVEVSRERVSDSGLSEPQVDPRLRERAERLLEGKRLRGWGEHLNEQDVLRLVHELQVHQVELEMQNEELRRAQIDLALTNERYSDLYDFAPVGYLSANTDGMIVRGNLTAAALLGMERRALVGKPLSRFIAADQLRRFHNIRRQLVSPEVTESAELLLQPADGEAFWARLEIVTRQDPGENVLLWQIAMSNIDAQKRAELVLHNVNQELEAQVERRTEQLTLANRQLVDEIDMRRTAEAGLREREELLERRVAERTAELATLLTISRDISSTLNIDAVLQIMLLQLSRIVAYSGCGIFLLNDRVLTLVAYRGAAQADGLVQSQTTLDESPLLRRVIEERQPLLVPDTHADTPITAEWRAHASNLQRQLLHNSRSWLGVPMIAQGRPIGALLLDHVAPGFFTHQHANLVLILASQAAIAIANARLYSQTQHMAAIEERQRLARELHDSVAQTFYSIALATHAARSNIAHDRELADRRLAHILDLADAGLTEMKALIFDLQAEGIRRDGLVQALRRHVDALNARNDLQVHADLGVEPEAGLEAKEAIYGIAREALQNVVRHASATELWLELRQSDDRLWVEVRDNGIGFTPDLAEARTLGLRSMNGRAAATGGRVEIMSKPGAGSVVRAQIPLTAN